MSQPSRGGHMGKQADAQHQRDVALANNYTFRQLQEMSRASYDVRVVLDLAAAMTVHRQRGTMVAWRDAVADRNAQGRGL